MSTTAIGTVLDAIQSGLSSVSGLSGVNVFSVPVSAEAGGEECIWMGDATFNEEESAMGGERGEVWDIEAQVWGRICHWEGDIEVTGREARDRLLELYALIETYINDTYTGTFPNVVITAGALRQGLLPDGHRCAMDFTLTMGNIKNP